MTVSDAIDSRRSIRRFCETPVSRSDVTALLEAARLAPSGTNAQPWKFLVTQSVETRNALAEASYNQRFIADAPVVVVALGDRQAFKKRLRRGKELVEIGAVDGELMKSVGDAYRKRFSSSSGADVSILMNCAIAVEHLILAATERGLGTCWVRLFDAEAVADVLSLPEHLFPVALVPLGYPDQAPPARPRYSLAEIAWDETIGTPWNA